jgi:putative endonuclease
MPLPNLTTLHSTPDRRGFVYILTNPTKTTLYIGATDNLNRRLNEHFQNCENGDQSFAAQYHIYHLVYYEVHDFFSVAIAREKQLKRWSRSKKDKLILGFKPTWEFLNDRSEVKFMWVDLGDN